HLLEVAALLATPGQIPDDPVKLDAAGPPTEADDRRAAAAFRPVAPGRLDELGGELEQELRSVVQGLPEGTTRIVFDFDPLLLVEGESVSWEALDEDGEPLAS